MFFMQVCQHDSYGGYVCGKQQSADFINDPSRGLCLRYEATTDSQRYNPSKHLALV